MTVHDIIDIIYRIFVEDCQALQTITSDYCDGKWKLTIETKRGQKFVLDIREE
jgi:hypothetical protein